MRRLGCWLGARLTALGLASLVSASAPARAEEAVAPPQAAQQAAAGEPAVEPAEPAEPAVIEVRGRRARSAVVPSLSRAQARELPGAFGDPLRAVDSLPGVVPTISGLPVYFIRGAPPASVGYFVDGVEVPLLFHAFLGPSVIHPGALSGVELESAPADVRYGGNAGAVIVARPSVPRASFGGEASLRLFDAGALLEAPFAGGDGSALVSGRYSFTGLLYSALTDEEFGYWDYQLRVMRRVSSTSSVGVFAFGAGDHYGGESLANNVGGDTGFHRLDLRYQHARRDVSVTTAVTLGRDETSDGAASLSDSSLRLRTEVDSALTRAVVLRLGAQARVDRIALSVATERSDRLDLLELFPSRTDHTLGAYVGLSIAAGPRLQIEPGVRADMYASQGEHAVAVDPRLRVSAELGRGVSVEHRFGLASQKPNFVPSVPAAQVGSLSRGLVTGVHASSALRVPLPLELSLTVAGFQSEYLNVIDPLGKERDFKLDRSVLDERQDIVARGLELRVGRPLTRRLGGFLGYTLSWSSRRGEREQSPSGYDRRHVLQGALAAELWWKLRAGTRVLYYSGFPALVIGEDGTALSSARRAPGFARIDLRLERAFRVADWLELTVVAEALNANNAKEALRYECGGRCELVTAGPITLPSLGVEAKF